MSETIIFGADWCRDCRRAKIIFDRAGVPYRYIDVDEDPAAIEVARDISGRAAIPVVLYPDRSHQVVPSNADMRHKIDELGLAGSQPAAQPTTQPTARPTAQAMARNAHNDAEQAARAKRSPDDANGAADEAAG